MSATANEFGCFAEVFGCKANRMEAKTLTSPPQSQEEDHKPVCPNERKVNVWHYQKHVLIILKSDSPVPLLEVLYALLIGINSSSGKHEVGFLFPNLMKSELSNQGSVSSTEKTQLVKNNEFEMPLGRFVTYDENSVHHLLQAPLQGLTTKEERPCNAQEQPSRKTNQWSPFSPCHTPTGHKTPVIMPVVPTNELCTSEEDLQGQIQAEGPVEVQLLGAEAEDASTPLASFPPVSSSSAIGDAEILLMQALNRMTCELLEFLILKYGTQEPIFQAEMLNTVLRDNQAHFPVVFRKATQCLQLAFGLDMKEVDHREHIYVMVPVLGLTLNEMQTDEQSIPKAGLLVTVLSLILLAGDRVSEENIWGALSRMGVFAGIKHCIYGEPKELLTQVWVRAGYLQYRQVPYSHPAHYEFLWGPRAYAETSKQKVKDYLHRVNGRGPRFFPPRWA
ncbi:hypothetical protein E5288_WYG020468 [Bos mutus]|uniref:MAGE domain-containing protein n=1 Tax=Bos mutus TaxID=72004 RepID=A0A6B0SE01_9CETA|nr:hypothetical protein [Bos mutus]